MIESDKSLKAYNTFGFECQAEYYAEASTEESIEKLVELATANGWPVFVLGAGSNLILTQSVQGLVIRLTHDSIRYMPGPTGVVRVSAGAGRNWHELVMNTLQHEAPGLENLSLIPGTTGAAPVQNIGAYGVEIESRLETVRVFHIPTRAWQTMTAAECEFSYRDSRFKRQAGEYIIFEVTLSLGYQHEVVTSYASLAELLQQRGVHKPSAKDVSEAVIAVRQSKLPDPEVIGNAGSFFHNPVVSEAQWLDLKKAHPTIAGHPADGQCYKVSAGWLIDNLGLKGFRQEGVGVHEHQALVLINDGNGTAEALMRLAEKIQRLVQQHYDIHLSIEPTVI